MPFAFDHSLIKGPIAAVSFGVILSACSTPAPVSTAGGEDAVSGTYDDLVTLFREWRAFEMPEFDAGVIPTVLTRWQMTGSRDPILSP